MPISLSRRKSLRENSRDGNLSSYCAEARARATSRTSRKRAHAPLVLRLRSFRVYDFTLIILTSRSLVAYNLTWAIVIKAGEKLFAIQEEPAAARSRALPSLNLEFARHSVAEAKIYILRQLNGKSVSEF